VGFTGGEPFLYIDEMRSVSEYASARYGLPSGAATNASWAVTLERAEEVLHSLHQVGLRHLVVSVDDFHQEWIPLERVSNCLAAAKAANIRCLIQCVVTAGANRLDHYLEALGVTANNDLAALEIPCTPIGSAAIQIPEDDFLTQPGVPAGYCTMFRSLTIRPEGDVTLCCGAAFLTAPLLAGNLRHERLDSIMERAEWDSLYNALAVGKGPSILARVLEEQGHDDQLLDGYASSCHACHHILSIPGIDAVLREGLEEQRSQLFLERMILEQEPDDMPLDKIMI
jgi:MoaA/NifB/PqqE/SkfB family radical SAM enzyme